jgi:ribosomal peptide maturation radical SAM protein 1
MMVERTKSAPQIALIQMPFAVTAWPSLGLSLLRSALGKRGISSIVYYLNLEFLKMVGYEIYQDLALGAPANTDLLGEWIFSESLWGADPRRDETYLHQILGSVDRTHYERFGTAKLEAHRQQAIDARAQVSRFLDLCMDAADWRSVRVVGFTSVFQQHIASLALAKRLKQAFPDLFIVFGGGNCEDEMGPATLRNFSFVDAVCCGEGDRVFPEFAALFLAGKALAVEGVITRQHEPEGQEVALTVPTAVNVPPVQDMDSLPYPDYGDYFEELSSVPITGGMPVRMMFETSRGCWWGQKHHCTFCGLNGVGMPFRHKSPQRALEEIQWLLEKYGAFTRKLSAADNIIPLEYFKSFLPQLEAMHLELDLFYETKANLTEAQVAQYKRAGLNQIQPGIESMNSPVLKLMRKGVSALQNIQLLKWCAQYGISAYWNYLFGFPGEAPDSYLGQEAILRSIVHLQPPVGCGPVRFDRFSPYHKTPAEFGVSNLVPYPAYSYVYPGLDRQELSRLAYYFVGDFEGKEQIPDYTSGIVDAVAQWQQVRNEVTLCHSSYRGRTTVFDGRDGVDIRVLILDGIYSKVLDRCASISAERSICEELAGDGHAPNDTIAALNNLVSRGLVISEDDRFLTVSVPLGWQYVPPDGALRKIQAQLKADERTNGGEGVLIPAGICTTMQ